MLCIIGALITSGYIGQFIFFNQNSAPSGFLGYFLGLLVWGALSILACIPWFGLATFIGLAFPTNAIMESKTELAALRVKDGVEGHFFLGSGTVEGKQYYFYYLKNEDGSLTPAKVNADEDVKIYEEERKDATLVKYNAEFKNEIAYIIGVPTMQGKKSVEFHVPVGTVKIGYEM